MVSRQVGRRQGASDNWLDTTGFTHLAGDSLLTTSGNNMIGGDKFALETTLVLRTSTSVILCYTLIFVVLRCTFWAVSQIGNTTNNIK